MEGHPSGRGSGTTPRLRWRGPRAPHLQSLVLCNLGTCTTSSPTPPWRAALRRGMRLARDLGDHLTEGQVLGYLGLLHAREGRPATRANA